jgi:hypothetical protein
MKNLNHLIAIISFSFIFTGCTLSSYRVAFIPISTLNQYPETNPDSVEVYITKLPKREFQETGIFYFPFRFTNLNPDKSALYIPRIKEFAAKYGANAVIRLDITDSTIKGVTVVWK